MSSATARPQANLNKHVLSMGTISVSYYRKRYVYTPTATESGQNFYIL